MKFIHSRSYLICTQRRCRGLPVLISSAHRVKSGNTSCTGCQSITNTQTDTDTDTIYSYSHLWQKNTWKKTCTDTREHANSTPQGLQSKRNSNRRTCLVLYTNTLCHPNVTLFTGDIFCWYKAWCESHVLTLSA